MSQVLFLLKAIGFAWKLDGCPAEAIDVYIYIYILYCKFCFFSKKLVL